MAVLLELTLRCCYGLCLGRSPYFTLCHLFCQRTHLSNVHYCSLQSTSSPPRICKKKWLWNLGKLELILLSTLYFLEIFICSDVNEQLFTVYFSSDYVFQIHVVETQITCYKSKEKKVVFFSLRNNLYTTPIIQDLTSCNKKLRDCMLVLVLMQNKITCRQRFRTK